MPKKGYIYYSGATNVTGIKLAEALKLDHGSELPAKPDNYSFIVGWGAKTAKPVNTGKTTVLNHPDRIRANRNKIEALEAMLKAGVSAEAFVRAEHIKLVGSLHEAGVSLPVIGRTKFHQGGKGFWHCPTFTHIKEAIKEGAEYFQNLIEIRDEYRLHVFGGQIIYAVKKVKRTPAEMEEAFIRHELDRQKELAKKNNDPFDEKTALLFLKRQAKKFAQDGANMLIRSNRLGWKFSKVAKISDTLRTEAVNAIKALGLEFGAVDACIDANGKAWIIEVNTGPGLEESSFKAYVDAFTNKISAVLSPKAEKAAGGAVGKKPKETPTPKDSKNRKQMLKEKLALAADLVDSADEEEAVVLDRLFQKMFGS